MCSSDLTPTLYFFDSDDKARILRAPDLCVCSSLDPKDTIGTKGALAAAGGGMQWCYAVRSCR